MVRDLSIIQKLRRKKYLLCCVASKELLVFRTQPLRRFLLPVRVQKLIDRLVFLEILLQFINTLCPSGLLMHREARKEIKMERSSQEKQSRDGGRGGCILKAEEN